MAMDDSRDLPTEFKPPTPIPTPLNVSALARTHGVSRTTIRKRLARGWTPPPPIVEVLPAFQGVPPRSTPGGTLLVVLALAIATLALIINAQTGWGFGTTPLAATTFAGLSIAADMLAIVLPSTALALWWNRCHLLATAAWMVWTLAVTMAFLASVGFASLHLGDTAAARAAIVATATATADQRSATIEAARAAAQAATVARQGECLKRGPLCRDLEHAEQVRMSELAAAIASPVPAAASIADADPQVTGAVRLAQWIGLGVTATDVGNLRLVLMALLPNIAGLVLAFGSALRR
jgi:hypothetical protein